MLLYAETAWVSKIEGKLLVHKLRRCHFREGLDRSSVGTHEKLHVYERDDDLVERSIGWAGWKRSALGGS